MAKKKTRNNTGKAVNKKTEEKIEANPEEKKPTKKEQIKSENNILRNFIIGLVVFVAIAAGFVIFSNSASSFEYKGIDFEIVQEGGLTLYRTDVPVVYQNTKTDFNIFFRNDPRDLDDIPFRGDIDLDPIMALSSTESFNCDGDGVIAIANLINLYKISGIDVVRDENATCDPEGRFTFIKLQEGEQTGIQKVGPSCYEVDINNCEILPATERLMIESLIEINRLF